ncbi:MAG: phospholipase D-like domain-containing protein [bacterium]|nr:phospholipase D-like domain-containing protein [bacterium]
MGKYVVLDTDTEKVYNVGDIETKNLKNFLVLRKNYIPKGKTEKLYSFEQNQIIPPPPFEFKSGEMKVFVSDETTKIKPDRNCETSMCREILNNINNSSQTIDMAVYGYSRVSKIENAISSAIKRGVKIRLVYDSDAKGGNIYDDTPVLKGLILNNSNDKTSLEANNIMHNKFYIFDNKIVITGSTNLSHTDMSGFNTNIMVSLNSPKAAQIYKQEFEQMYNGKYHNEKAKTIDNNISDKIKVYFSPQDKGIQNAILPLIDNAKNYIYIPTFVLTEKRVTNSLIQAKNRNVDIKIIMDALNASMRHTKHKELRQNGILVKTENYAGKMHAKTMIIDDRYVVIGSMNFSNSGENRNDENMLVIENPEVAKYLKQFFDYQWNKIDNKWLKYNARAEGNDSIGSCNDGLDNNYDGFTDRDDPACKG